jgi:hypothetical protein
METWGIVGPRGSKVFSRDGMPVWEWARCHKAGCNNFVCRNLSDVWCSVHVDGSPTLGEIIEALPVKVDASRCG